MNKEATSPDPCRIQIGDYTFDFDWNALHRTTTPLVLTNAWRVFTDRVLESTPQLREEFRKFGLSHAINTGFRLDMPIHEWLLRKAAEDYLDDPTKAKALFGTPLIHLRK